MSSKRHIRRTKCEHGISYRSFLSARAAASGVMEMGGEYLEVVPCDECRRYHLKPPPVWLERMRDGAYATAN